MKVQQMRFLAVLGFITLLLFVNVIFFMNNDFKDQQDPAEKKVQKMNVRQRIDELNNIRLIAAAKTIGSKQLLPGASGLKLFSPNMSCLKECGALDFTANVNYKETCMLCSKCGPPCRNRYRNDQCEKWKEQGECAHNPGFMQINCAVSCQSCGTPRYSHGKQLSYFVELSNGLLMPRIGFGTAALGDSTRVVVTNALKVGYTLFDTAEAKEWYRQDQVGLAIAASDVLRDQLFITSKIHPRNFGYYNALNTIQKTLSELQIDYLDQFLLHYAHCFSGLIGCDNKRENEDDLLRETWQALEDSYQQGLVLSIGVSNFDQKKIEKLNQFAQIKPMVLQRNSDPLSQDVGTRKFCVDNNIQYVAYSSLGTQHQMRMSNGKNPVLSNEVLIDIGQQVGGKGVAEVVLRWALQEGQIVIPRTRNVEHMQQNLDVLNGFQLSDMQLNMVDCLDGQQ
eukprot:TRINITY_DN755_c0_g6_i1.p1 TRINITY_DN755_c0_g6~~TRINITY_DN755_c0_g6_i1.p1  ORF type:complete len:451 (-),score=39.96 TRINITY_DN755_c0_g6_i1:152-1504(-)